AEILGRLGRPTEGRDGVGDVALGHRAPVGLPGVHAVAGALEGHGRSPVVAHLHWRHHTHVPQLRAHLPTGGVHFVDHALPTGQRSFTVEVRHIGVVAGGGPVDHRALGNDQAHFVLGATAVVGGHIGPGHTIARE